jgi:hypothetical protein
MQIVAEGYDPNIGYLHASSEDRPAALVFDLMEPLRPIVDRSVLQFVQSHTFHPADFTIRSDGVCRLNPEMARSLVRTTVMSPEMNYLLGMLGLRSIHSGDDIVPFRATKQLVTRRFGGGIFPHVTMGALSRLSDGSPPTPQRLRRLCTFARLLEKFSQRHLKGLCQSVQYIHRGIFLLPL